MSQISIMITDKAYTASDASVLYYGALTTTLDDTKAGTGTFELPTSLPDGYKIYMMAEDVNDGNLTDYSSTPVEIVPQLAFDVTIINPTNSHITLSTAIGNGTETQNGLTGAITPVVYTADDGYYFPEEYTVTGSNGIKVTRDSYTQITVSGTPTADASITLVAATEKATPTVDTPTVAGFTYDPGKTLNDVSINSGTNSVEGSWSWKTKDTVPTVNNNGYTAVFTPNDKDNYNTVEKTVTVAVTKATPVVNVLPTASAITYGQTLSDSVLSNGTAKYSESNDTAVTGSYAWKAGTTKPAVADSNTTEYDVTFTPSDTVNYNGFTVKVMLTVNKADSAPNMPGATMAPAHSKNTVGAVTLPTDWIWNTEDATKTLSDGVAVTATALYNGTDKGNYEKESVEITLTRANCDHTKTEIRNAKDATCTEEGYTGDTYCKDCGTKIATGKVIKATGHKWSQWKVTKKATYDQAGVETRTCSACGKKETRSIAKLIKKNVVTKGKTYIVKSMKYKVTKVAGSKAGMVTYTGTTKSKNITSLTIGKTVQIGGKTFKITAISDKAFKNYKKLKKVTIGANVTSIGKETFAGCKVLKTITIQSKSLKKVGKSAIKGINKKATIKVPSSKVKAYKKLFKSSIGLKKSMKIKK